MACNMPGSYPIAIAIGDGVTATLPLLWGFMISAAFAHPQGLFVVHFRWPQTRVARAMRYYSLTIGLIAPLIMLLIAFASLEDRKFYSTLGRLCFILICGALSIVTLSLKRAGIPLFPDKAGSGGSLVNTILWNLLIATPLIAALAACIGYLATSKGVQARQETRCQAAEVWQVNMKSPGMDAHTAGKNSQNQSRPTPSEISPDRQRRGSCRSPRRRMNLRAVIDLDVISAQRYAWGARYRTKYALGAVMRLPVTQKFILTPASLEETSV